MAEALELGIGDLIAELLTYALVFLGSLKAAGAIASSFLESLLYGFNYFFIFIKSDFRLHKTSPFLF